jgi:ferredoxin
MKIDEEACVGCRLCLPYCPMNAISFDRAAKVARINSDECVDCGVCFRSGICPAEGAIVEEVAPWPRSVRGAFSNPLIVHRRPEFPVEGLRRRRPMMSPASSEGDLLGSQRRWVVPA